MGLTKDITNKEINNEISAVLSNVLDLKIMVHDLADENKELRAQLTLKASIKLGEFGYIFADGDPNPLCPKCYERDGKVVHLPPAKPLDRGIRRVCVVCDQIYWEKDAPHTRNYTSKSHWME